jgi:hypothetical protein
MGKQIQFDYYYGIEAEQFSFYRVPRLLIKDERFKGLSSDAKLLSSDTYSLSDTQHFRINTSGNLHTGRGTFMV